MFTETGCYQRIVSDEWAIFKGMFQELCQFGFLRSSCY